MFGRNFCDSLNLNVPSRFLSKTHLEETTLKFQLGAKSPAAKDLFMNVCGTSELELH